MPLVPGGKLGPYEILGPLDEGGMGQVYRAHDGRLGRDVAIKVLRDDFALNPDWLARFEREARLLAALVHPNVATVHGLDEADGVRYLVMELVPGQTLHRHLAAGPLPPVEGLGVCRQVAEALEAAHENGIIHRDLKPGNVMITPDGKVKVLDFGLAKSTTPPGQGIDPAIFEVQTTPEVRHTQEGAIVGTAAYMAPEQARGKPVDRRCDIWAFGCVLYEAITGKQAFQGPTFSDTLAAVLERSPDWRALPDRLPPRVSELIRRCLHKDPQRRLRDVGDARLEIEEALSELASPRVQKPAPSPRRWAGLAVLVGTIVLGVGVAIGTFVRSPSPPESPSTAPPAGWSAQFLLGAPNLAFGPRVSPDGRWLAFTVLHEGQAQVGVMKLDTGEWSVRSGVSLDGGLLSGVCWSADSALLYFDRFSDVPAGVFSVSPLGGAERLVVKEAESPQVVATDQSIVVCKLDDRGNYRLHRHWPNTGRPDVVVSPPIEFVNRGMPKPVRVLRQSAQVVFWGKILVEEGTWSKLGFYLLDLDSKKYRALTADLPAGESRMGPSAVQLAIPPGDDFVYTVVPSADLFQVVRFPLSGGPTEPLIPLTLAPWGLDVDARGMLYLDQFQRSLEVLRFPASGGRVERIASSSRGREIQPVELPDGRVLLPSLVAGRDRLLAAEAFKDPLPLLPLDKGETAPPAVLLNNHQLAFVSGSADDRHLKVARLEDGQWLVDMALQKVAGKDLMGLAVSNDGATLYYVRDRKVWEVRVTDDAEPKPITDGDGVAVHPASGELLIQRFEGKGVSLYLGPPGSGLGRRIDVDVQRGGLRLAPYAMFGNTIRKDGRVLVAVAAHNSWFWRVATLDLTTGRLDLIPTDFQGDIYPASWRQKKGLPEDIIGMGYSYRSDLWQLRPGPYHGKD